ncbi:hypothetical protein [uncultured Brevundimonas sp.]|uniref:hypothetical protein n=1 Tax=uncultured Brevundimonas sp. TaxID=213418 RepID=UPI0026003079|nr:hypothetical protein [uncultured Brevundimonas sp.]
MAGYEHRFAPDVDEFRLRFELSVIHDPARRLTDWQLIHFRVPRNFARSHLEPVLEQVERLLESPYGEQTLEMVAQGRKISDDENQILFNFDLSRPLKPQLDVAARYLTEVQREKFGKVATRRPRRTNWPEFLRAIDARDAGATYREMRDVFWPDRSPRKDGREQKTEQNARDVHAAACKLRDNFPI